MGLKQYLLKRLLHSVFVMFFVVTVVFAAVRSIPGDPARLMLGGDVDTETLQALRTELGLNQPLYIQYLRWLRRLLSGDLGESIRTGEPVLGSLVQVAGPTVSIAALGMVIALVVAIPTGILSSVRRYEVEDYLSTAVAFFGISMPAFWIGIVLILLIGVNVEAIPTFGYTPLGEGVWPWFKSILLPAFAVGFPYGGILMRMMRSSMLEVLNEDYMRTARAKGLSSNLVLFKHGLQNALIPVVTLAGIFLAVVLGGVVAVEIVFGIRGLGRLLIGSINRRDFPVIQGTVLVIAFVFVLANIVIDLLYTMINPRIKYGGGE
ncbi:MAG: ABC-type dipeptide/oligopeptide/nickel transport system, permease component [uncultured archaeon A07HR67]|nr:MAG: ABC-type dipeptide/oligopeptide/nickel transport system, permease component [uncultured archaeon A07HR67]